MVDVIIIGAGPAGLTAAIYAGRAGRSALVLESAMVGGQAGLTNEIENYPGFPDGILGVDVGMQMEKQAKKFGAEVRSTQVLSIAERGANKVVVTPDGELECRAVIVATGAKPRLMSVPGEQELTGMGVSYCATCDGFFYRGKDVAVVGGGDTALSDAMYLANLANKVYLVHRRDELRGVKHLQQKVQELSNVEMVLSHIPVSVNGTESVESLTVQDVSTKQNRDLAVAGIFVAVGTIPNTALFEGTLDLDKNGYIITDTRMNTSLPGVFAAGDVRNTPLRQVVTACADGAIAASSAERSLD